MIYDRLRRRARIVLHRYLARPRRPLRVTSFFQESDDLTVVHALPAVIRMNSIGPDGRRVESRLYIDQLHKVQLARAMQRQFLRPDEIVGVIP